jgi:predicted kinase
LVAELEQKSLMEFARLRPLLTARGRQGLIRRGHGDLHLGNIAILDGKPIAFDALEFDPVIASGDVLYDLAFLLMDLVERGLEDAANAVMNGYFTAARRIEDYDGIAALPFFMSLRAAIRAMVTVSRLDLAQRGVAQSAKRYFALALALLAPKKPTVVCTGGLSGTGKSLLARSLAPGLAPSPGALILRSDVERKADFGVAENERLPPEAYRLEVSEKIYGIVNDKAARIACAGHSVIIDAVFAGSRERSAIETAVAATGAGFRGLFLVADLQTRLKRVGTRAGDPSDADADVVRKQELFAVGSIGWDIVDASGSPADTLLKARAAIERHA